MSDVLNLAQFILKVLKSSRAEGLAVSLVNFSVAVFLKELLGLLLHFLGHMAGTLGPDMQQDEAALQHIWEGPSLKDDMKTKQGSICRRATDTCPAGTCNPTSHLPTLLRHS